MGGGRGSGPPEPESSSAIKPEVVEEPRRPREDPDQITPSQALVQRTDRALGLVEKSLNTFMLMHREVITEKERLVEEMKGQVREKAERLRELEKIIHQREQEIADLKMLVGLLEDQLSRMRLEASYGPAEREGRTVGDLIQDQLAYLMEGQMIQELTRGGKGEP